jgi:hypothetical protein
MHGTITSDAHEWVQTVPLSDKTLRCTRCDERKPMSGRAAKACRPHYEFATSGYRDVVGPYSRLAV